MVCPLISYSIFFSADVLYPPLASNAPNVIIACHRTPTYSYFQTDRPSVPPVHITAPSAKNPFLTKLSWPATSLITPPALPAKPVDAISGSSSLRKPHKAFIVWSATMNVSPDESSARLPKREVHGIRTDCVINLRSQISRITE